VSERKRSLQKEIGPVDCGSRLPDPGIEEQKEKGTELDERSTGK